MAFTFIYGRKEKPFKYYHRLLICLGSIFQLLKKLENQRKKLQNSFEVQKSHHLELNFPLLFVGYSLMLFFKMLPYKKCTTETMI